MANYNLVMHDESRNSLGEIIRQQRVTMRLTLQELATMSGVSSSYLGRIENRERSPSARVLRKIAQPLGFEENELFTLAGYLSPPSLTIAEGNQGYNSRRVDPYVASVLAQEPAEVQRAVIGILTMLKSIARSTAKESS